LSPANYTLTGWLGTDGATVTKTLGSYNNANAGVGKTVTVSLSRSDYQASGGTDLSNYSLPTSLTGLVGVITPKNVSLSSFVVADKVYDGNNLATITSGTVLTGVGSETLSVRGTGTFSDKNVGDAKLVTASDVSALTQLDGSGSWLNYKLVNSGVTSTATITPKVLTAVVTPQDKVYDGTRTASLTVGSLSGVLAGDVVRVGATSGSFADANVSRDASGQVLAKGVQVESVSLSGADAGNYSLAGEGADLDVQARIVPRPLSLDALAQDKMYDGTRAAVVRVGPLTGLVGQQQLGLSVQAEFDTPDVGSNKPVDVRYTLSDGVGGLARNYTLPSPQLLASIRSETQVKPVQPMVVPSQVSAKPSSVVFVPSSSAAAAQAAVLSQDPAATTPGSCRPETMGECVCEDTLLAEVQLCYVPHSADELASVSRRP
jgi:hypothetical protein